MSAIRINPPGRPVVLYDEGPALAVRHRWDIMRRTLDVALADRRHAQAMPLK